MSVLGLILLLGLSFLVYYILNHIIYEEPLDFIVHERKLYFTRLKLSKQKKLNKLKSKNNEKYACSIKKLRKDIRDINLKLKLLESYQDVKKV